jgi:hypothetical protein
MKSAFLFGAVMFMATMASACPGRAAGAVALGLPSDVAKEGVSIFTQVDSRTSEEAKTSALAGCKSIGSQTTRDLCKIVATFQNQCVAEALDPESGTPGFGWAMAQTSGEAKSQALAIAAIRPGRQGKMRVLSLTRDFGATVQRSECHEP